LYDKVCRADILSHAYNLVRANKGSAGIDGATFEAIEEKEGASAFLAELEEALKSKAYQASLVKRVMIPKEDGTERPLGIPTIRDRVAQMAVKLVIEPVLGNMGVVPIFIFSRSSTILHNFDKIVH
jgi:RNA-directed DNA polymerase